MNDNELKNDNHGVELIASGYDWDCPNCGMPNHEIELTEFVTCEKCHLDFNVTECHHAIG